MSDNPSTTFTIRLPEDVKRRLEELAKATSRTPSWLAADALATYLARQEWEIGEIEEGIKDAEAGRLVPHEDVRLWLNSWGTDYETDAPKCE